MTRIEELDIEEQKIRYMYIALLHYTSELTGDSVDKINAEIEHSCNFEIVDNKQQLNG
jgi:hypothetical protein